MTLGDGRDKARRYRRLAAAMAAVALVCIVTPGCGSASATKETANPPAPAAPTVDVIAVKSQRLNISVPLPGEITAYESVPVYAKVSGFVKSIAVDRGSHVKRGQVIARLEAPELVAQRAEAQAKLQSAQAQLASAQAKLASDESTNKRLQAASATPGVVAGNDVEISTKSVEASRAQVGAQQETVAAARQALESVAEVAGYLDVRAPFDGVVTERNVHPGALVGPAGAASGAEPLVRIDSVSRLRVVVPVPETYVAGVAEGRVVEFTVAAYPGQTFSGKIARVSHAVTVKTRTMPVELDVPNPSGELTPGTFADVRWPVERPSPTLFVPPSAVASTLDRTFVVRVRNGKSEWVDVKTGATAGNLVEVFGDLKEGDTVAIRGTDELRPGMAIAATAKR
jgi:membrane fusion protein (multidrug efflux system)